MKEALIDSYYQEARKLWKARGEWVRSREFYEMWESVIQPKPFLIQQKTLTVQGTEYPLFPADVTDEESSAARVLAVYQWDGVMNCAALVVESALCITRFHFLFDAEGNPLIKGPEMEVPDDRELSHGEKLELIYDVLSHLHKKRGVQREEIKNMTRDQYMKAIDVIQKYHEKNTVSVMRRLPQKMVLKLVIEAMEDSPRGELEDSASDESGKHNAFTAVNDSFGALEQAAALSNEALFPVPAQTVWQITEQLDCLSLARQMVTDYEKVCRIPFDNVEVMHEDEERQGEFGIKFSVRPDLPVVEGDVMTFYNGGGDAEGTLMVDIYDGRMIYGRVRFDDRYGKHQLTPELWALPVPSSAAYLSEAMSHLSTAVRLGGKQISEATRAVLGVDQVFQYHKKPVNPPEALDAEQAVAWSESVDSRNKVVLVQGPPGTGKTSVLSAVLRTLVERGCRIMIAAPSNAAVDNLVRRIQDLPVLRIARQREYISPDIASKFWEGEVDHIRRFAERMKKCKGGAVFAGTQVSLMKSRLIHDELDARGHFDAVIFDEAGMTRIEELILCTDMAKRTVLFGDHRQLLPFPLPAEILAKLRKEWGEMTRSLSTMLERSALEWLCEGRGFPTILLKNSYRCQNPRLIRFSSTLFYNAAVRTSSKAEYYRLPERERQKLYPPSTLCLYNTADLDPLLKGERIVFEGQKPGIENRLEAELSARVVEELASRYPLAQITVIVPYRRQVRLVRQCLNARREKSAMLGRVGKGEWDIFLSMRISTVDSFQGGESDAVVISYVRSNQQSGVGFVDEPNRINVAHTRCRRELVVIGDFGCLRENGKRIFVRMERAFERDGKVIRVTKDMLAKWNVYVPAYGRIGYSGKVKKPFLLTRSNMPGKGEKIKGFWPKKTVRTRTSSTEMPFHPGAEHPASEELVPVEKVVAVQADSMYNVTRAPEEWLKESVENVSKSARTIKTAITPARAPHAAYDPFADMEMPGIPKAKPRVGNSDEKSARFADIPVLDE